jgi:hypothetical protein
MQHARDRVRDLTAHRRLWLPVDAIVQDVNTFLRGWAGYCVSRGRAWMDWRAVGLMV